MSSDLRSLPSDEWGSSHGGRDAVDAIECKWKPDAFEARGLAAFRADYPNGRNYLVSPLNGPAYDRMVEGLKVSVVSPQELRERLT